MVHGVSMRRTWKALVVAFIGLDVSLAYSGKNESLHPSCPES
jgi:hypothetical protein